MTSDPIRDRIATAHEGQTVDPNTGLGYALLIHAGHHLHAKHHIHQTSRETRHLFCTDDEALKSSLNEVFHLSLDGAHAWTHNKDTRHSGILYYAIDQEKHIIQPFLTLSNTPKDWKTLPKFHYTEKRITQ